MKEFCLVQRTEEKKEKKGPDGFLPSGPFCVFRPAKILSDTTRDVHGLTGTGGCHGHRGEVIITERVFFCQVEKYRCPKVWTLKKEGERMERMKVDDRLRLTIKKIALTYGDDEITRRYAEECYMSYENGTVSKRLFDRLADRIIEVDRARYRANEQK